MLLVFCCDAVVFLCFMLLWIIFSFFFYPSPPPRKLCHFLSILNPKKILILTLLALLNFYLLCVFSFSPLLNSTTFNFTFPYALLPPIVLRTIFKFVAPFITSNPHHSNLLQQYYIPICLLTLFIYSFYLICTTIYLNLFTRTLTYLLLSPYFLCKTIWPLFLDPTRHLPWNIASSPS